MSKITIDRALIDRVLKVLTDCRAYIARWAVGPYMAQYYDKAISDLREALKTNSKTVSAKAQPQQAPKFLYDEEEGLLHDPFDDAPTGCIDLYTSPPASTATSEDVRLARKPLTDEEILSLWSPESLRPVLGKNKVLEFARAIEADHGLKETP